MTCLPYMRPPVAIPEWMTMQQAEAVHKLYERNPDGSETREEFFARVDSCIGGFCGLTWCGMFVGIEPDGYTHT